jgi:hypothetical protein
MLKFQLKRHASAAIPDTFMQAPVVALQLALLFPPHLS